MTSAAIREVSDSSLTNGPGSDDSSRNDSVQDRFGRDNSGNNGSATTLATDTDLNARVIALLAAYPGIQTLTGLVSIDPNALNQSGRIDYLSALERQSAWLQAVIGKYGTDAN